MSTNNNLWSYTTRMHKLTYILILFISVLTIISCSSEDEIETDVELQPYFDIFAEEAALRGFTVDYVGERIEGLLQDITDSSIQGQCFRNEEKPRKVIIDTEYWANADAFEKEFIIFHELGHCFLNRDHLNSSDNKGNCISIMHANPGVCNFSLDEDNRELYLDELFSQ